MVDMSNGVLITLIICVTILMLDFMNRMFGK